jgi:hypothetical protein
MPAERLTPTDHLTPADPADTFADTLARIGVAARTARAALGRLTVEGWLAVACAVVVMWALGWF